MGWFGRSSKPAIDPSGRDRSSFRQVGRKVAHTYLRENDPAKAVKIMENWSNQIASRFGEFHPDIGRGLLLLSVMLAMRAQYPGAMECAETARKMLENLGANDFDFVAAEFLEKELSRLIAGARLKNEIAIIDDTTPAGKFLMDLK